MYLGPDEDQNWALIVSLKQGNGRIFHVANAESTIFEPWISSRRQRLVEVTFAFSLKMHILDWLYNINKMDVLFYSYKYTKLFFKFCVTFERKFPNLKQLVVSKLSKEELAVSKTEITNTAH